MRNSLLTIPVAAPFFSSRGVFSCSLLDRFSFFFPSFFFLRIVCVLCDVCVLCGGRERGAVRNHGVVTLLAVRPQVEARARGGDGGVRVKRGAGRGGPARRAPGGGRAP